MTTLSLEGELTIQCAEQLKESLLAAAEGCAELDLDLAAVTEIDTAGVQLLIALRKMLAARGARLRLVNVSAPVEESLALLRIADRFAA